MTSLELNKLKLKNKMLQKRKMMFCCIQYEVLQDNPVDVAYKNYCRAFGDGAMKYADFDFWYYQIVNGELDLDHDRSTDPPAKELSDMPVEVSEEIFGNLEWKDRCAARKVSRNIRFLGDNSKQYFKDATYLICSNESALQFKQQDIESTVLYKSNPDDDAKVCIRYDRKEKVINEKKHWKPALNDFIQIFKCQKVKIDELNLRLRPYQEEDSSVIDDILKDALRSIKHKISVKSLKVYANNEVAVLPYLKPGVLERIEIHGNSYRGQINIDELAELDQFKQAKYLRVYYVTCNRIDSLFNLTGFDVNIPAITNEDFIRLKNALRSSSNLEYGHVNLVGDMSAENLRSELGMEQVSIEDDLTIRFESNTIRFYGKRWSR